MQQTIKAVEKTNEAMSETMNSLLIRDEKLDDMLRKTTEMSDISSSIARKVGNAHIVQEGQAKRHLEQHRCQDLIRDHRVGRLFVNKALIYALMAYFCGLDMKKCFS